MYSIGQRQIDWILTGVASARYPFATNDPDKLTSGIICSKNPIKNEMINAPLYAREYTYALDRNCRLWDNSQTNGLVIKGDFGACWVPDRFRCLSSVYRCRLMINCRFPGLYATRTCYLFLETRVFFWAKQQPTFCVPLSKFCEAAALR